ncbi:hypothetical protein [Metaclostridioides mangenotii]|uniref:hypothetical protein n=1 Tax=Metaclostridioides mangenotii TaxID=1540 RepID=UPI00047F3C8B|nr:hypothetical protein [Clostridioides mangenotii]
MKNNNTNNTIAFRKKDDDSTNNSVSDKKIEIGDSPKVIPFPKNGKRDDLKKKKKAKNNKKNSKDSYINFSSINEFKNNFNRNRASRPNSNIYAKIFYLVLLILLVALVAFKIVQDTNSYAESTIFSSVINDFKYVPIDISV